MEDRANRWLRADAAVSWITALPGLIDPAQVAAFFGAEEPTYSFLVRLWSGLLFLFGWFSWDASRSAGYRFAMGYGASLMFGWTLLLAWAWRRPLEGRAVAGLTLLVICGLVLTEVIAVYSGELEAWRMLPARCLQVILLTLFGAAYSYRLLERWIGGQASV